MMDTIQNISERTAIEQSDFDILIEEISDEQLEAAAGLIRRGYGFTDDTYCTYCTYEEVCG